MKIAVFDKLTCICPFLHIDECYRAVLESARHEPDK